MIKTSQINVDTAYWVATEINIQDNTTVVLKQPQHYLILIAEKITVGQNVTFTWERPSKSSPATPWKPATPQQAATSTSLEGITGTNGTHVVKGGRASDGHSAPELEVWVLDMVGRPAFDLRGQDGTTGGVGQEGGNGGQGGKGKPAQLDWSGFCKSGAGAGGNGGAGGPVGDSVKANFGAVCGPGPRTAGSKGPDGSYSGQGASGYEGGKLTEPLSMRVIDPDDFRRKLLEPVIFEASPSYTFAADCVTLTGQRFTKSDVVLIDGSPIQTNVNSDTSLQFLVPFLRGGQHTLQVKQSDGTLSNKASLYIKPKVNSAQQDNNVTVRVSPGKKVSLIGSGFSENAIVRINGQDMPDVALLSPTQLEFTLIRPSSVEENPSGETVMASVLLSDGTPSNTINIVLDTFHMLGIGDSVSWGQGLAPHEKHYSLVGNAVKANLGNIGHYTQVLAHSGAIIGVDATSTNPVADGEVPLSHPTILEQCDLFIGEKGKVDLIIMDGGINDVNLRTVLNPFDDTELAALHRTHFLVNSKKLMSKVAEDYPHAKVIVTGYYPPVSEHSDLSAVEVLLVALGVAVQGVPGGVVSGFLTRRYMQEACNLLTNQNSTYNRLLMKQMLHYRPVKNVSSLLIQISGQNTRPLPMTLMYLVSN